ncbi:MAG: hypothetical protein NVSMB17_12900 [Candidatus Dormibacteria bacterium]
MHDEPLTRGGVAVPLTALVAGSEGDGAHAASVLQALLDSAVHFSRAVPVAQLASLAVEEARVLLPGMDCFVGLVSPDSPGFVTLSAASTGAAQPSTEDLQPIEGSWIGLSLRQGHPVSLYRGERQEPGRPWFRDGAGAVRMVPLLPDQPLEDGRRGLGVIGFTREDPAPFSDLERAISDELGRQLGQALQAAEVRDALQQRARRLQAGIDVAMDLATRDPDAAAQQLLRRAVDAAAADRGFLLSGSGRRLVVSHTHGARGINVARGTRAPGSGGLVGAAISARVGVLGTADDRLGLPDPYRQLLQGMRHFAILPLVLGGELEAVMVVARSRDVQIGPDDISVLQQIGNIAGLALRSNRLLGEATAAREEATRTARRLGIGIDVAADLASSLDPDEVRSRLLAHAASAIEADRAVLCSLDGDELVVESSFALEPGSAEALEARFPMLQQGFVAESVRSRQPITASAPGTVLGLSARDVDTLRRLRHGLSVPLVLGGETNGVLVLWRGSDVPFAPADVAVAQTIANVAVLGLENAQAYSGVETASAAKTMFLNMAAHELRTPLTVIAGYLAMLVEGSISPEAATSRVYPMMQRKTEELARLVDGLLTAARLERKSSLTQAAPLDIVRAARAAASRVRPRADLLGGKVEFEGPDGVALALADEDSLGRILDNLLNNGLTYSQGEPWVKVTVSVGETVDIRVEDHGLGIPSDKREAIFERLVRVDRPEIGYPPGTGLGLYISRELARAMGGSLVLESTSPGRGSTFKVSLTPPRSLG